MLWLWVYVLGPIFSVFCRSDCIFPWPDICLLFFQIGLGLPICQFVLRKMILEHTVSYIVYNRIVLISDVYLPFCADSCRTPYILFLASLFANLFLAKFFLCRLFLDTLFLFVIELIFIFPLHRLVWGQLFFLKLDWCFYQVWLSEISWTLSFKLLSFSPLNRW